MTRFAALGCADCHRPPLFESEAYFDRGIGGDGDAGRYEHTRTELDRRAFRVPTLRNVAFTAPDCDVPSHPQPLLYAPRANSCHDDNGRILGEAPLKVPRASGGNRCSWTHIGLPNRIDWTGRSPDEHPTVDAQSNNDDRLQIRRGATLLLYGPPSGGKEPFLFNLTATRVALPHPFEHWKLGPNGGALIVSFRGDGRDYWRSFEESKALQEKWRANVSYTQLQWYSADVSVRAPHIAHELLRTIQRARRERLPLDWIAFMDVDAVEGHLPAAHNDPSFWPTILAITASEQVTTAFVVNEAIGQGNFIARHWQDMDYALHFSSRGPECFVEVEKATDQRHSTRYRFSADGGRVAPLRVGEAQ